MALEDIIVKSEGKLFNNASQAWNHIFYFFQFSPMVLKSRQDLCAIGSRSNSAVLMNSSISLKRQALPYSVPDGYGWQSITTTKLCIIQGKNAENPLTKGLKPLLVFDVWEHAYYLDYQNLRADYLHKLWDIVDWSVIEMRYR